MKNIDDNILFLFDTYIADDILLSEQFKYQCVNNDINDKLSVIDNPYFLILKDFDLLTKLINYLVNILNNKNPEHIIQFDEIINEPLIDFIFYNKKIYNNIITTPFNNRYNIINNFLTK